MSQFDAQNVTHILQAGPSPGSARCPIEIDPDQEGDADWRSKLSVKQNGDGMSTGRGDLHAQFLDFFVVVFAVQDIPLLTALQNRALLVLDLVLRGLVYLFFVIQ